jgi:hypothetical protein
MQILLQDLRFTLPSLADAPSEGSVAGVGTS